ncbi:hypothetical protein PG985_010987 [Apiospora marii]|uniref:uncharacterized protein n=1 Tax=Apiospora marii TaxID=335849 RepID=UPI00312D309E
MTPAVFLEFPKSDRFEEYCDAQSELEAKLFLHEDDYRRWQFSNDQTIEGGGVIKPSDVWSVVGSELKTTQPKFFKNCSTHIHISFPEQDVVNRSNEVPVRKARRVFLAAHIFEKAIDDLMPTGWTNRRYARSLQMPISRPYCLPEDVGKPKRVDDLCEFWRAMKSCTRMAKLAGVVNYVPNYAEEPRNKREEARYFKWNCYSHKPKIHYRTLEFRQAPPALSPRDVELWVHFVVGFVRAAVAIEGGRIDEAVDKAVEAGSDAPIYGLYADEGTLPVDLVALRAFMGHKIPQSMPIFHEIKPVLM